MSALPHNTFSTNSSNPGGDLLEEMRHIRPDPDSTGQTSRTCNIMEIRFNFLLWLRLEVLVITVAKKPSIRRAATPVRLRAILSIYLDILTTNRR
jgi:hypothetical protein